METIYDRDYVPRAMSLKPHTASATRAGLLVALFTCSALVTGCHREQPTSDIPSSAGDAAMPLANTTIPDEVTALSRALPSDGIEGYDRVVAAPSREGVAEARLIKNGTELAHLMVVDAATDVANQSQFSHAKDTLGGNPITTVGKNQSVMLVNRRYQLKVSSSILDADARRQLLSKFHLVALEGH